MWCGGGGGEGGDGSGGAGGCGGAGCLLVVAVVIVFVRVALSDSCRSAIVHVLVVVEVVWCW